MIINNQMAKSIQQLGQVTKSNTTNQTGRQSHQGEFQKILHQQLNQEQELKFSKHASMRLELRQIDFSANQLERLQNGLASARNKGVKESLMLVDDVALIVNVENGTVVTALNKEESKEHVFTNIDGALLV
jgi:flagellar operon protein